LFSQASTNTVQKAITGNNNKKVRFSFSLPINYIGTNFPVKIFQIGKKLLNSFKKAIEKRPFKTNRFNFKEKLAKPKSVSGKSYKKIQI
jgi:hypothetical protein